MEWLAYLLIHTVHDNSLSAFFLFHICKPGTGGRNEMEYKFTISGVYYGKDRVFPGLNEYIHECGRHPKAGGKLKKDYQMIAVNAIRKSLGRAKIRTPIHIHYDFYEVDMKRDKMNIFSFADKVIEDALQEAQYLKNDGWNDIENTSHDFFIDRKNPRIEVTITEMGVN